MLITEHALDRYQQRVDRSATRQDVADALRHARRPTKLDHRRLNAWAKVSGYRIHNPAVRFDPVRGIAFVAVGVRIVTVFRVPTMDQMRRGAVTKSVTAGHNFGARR